MTMVRTETPGRPGTGQSSCPIDAAGLRPYYRWELLALLFCAFFFHQGDRAIFGVVLPAIRADLHLSDSQLGLVGSVLFFMLAVMAPVAGYLGDVWNRKKVIIGSLLFWSVATLCTGLAGGLAALILLRSVATAGGESFYSPAAYPLLAAYHVRTRALALSIHQSSLYIGVMVTGFLAGYIAERWGWRSTFLMYGGGGIALGFLFMWRLLDAPPVHPGTAAKEERGIHAASPAAEVPAPKLTSALAIREVKRPEGRAPAQAGPTARPRESAWQALGVVFRCPTALLLTLGFTAIVFVNNAYVVWAPVFLQERFHLSLTQAGGYAMFYHHLAALLGVVIGGWFSDRRAALRPVFRPCMMGVAMLLAVPVLFLLGRSTSLLGACGAMAGFGLFRGLYEANTHAALFQVIAPAHRASAVGLMTMLAFLVGSASPWLLGRLRESCPPGLGLGYGFSGLSGAYLLGALAVGSAVLFTFKKDYQPEH